MLHFPFISLSVRKDIAIEGNSYHAWHYFNESSDMWSSGQAFRFHILGAFIVSRGVAAFHKCLMAKPRKKAYIDFCRNYDSMKNFEIKEVSIFQSAK